ncbi:unnamed protein product [Linum tenue]|uniref:Uncharacterized protein n=1 Tax=Linum tenue TaxID=586396 RepID=A0AAV0JMR8_9ROSI|nr:unnamed protein product [Linum tenue]
MSNLQTVPNNLVIPLATNPSRNCSCGEPAD